MKTYYVIWHYVANYMGPAPVEAESPQEATDKVIGICDARFKSEARVYVFDSPPVLKSICGKLVDPLAKDDSADWR